MKLGFFTAALPGNTLEQAAKWGAESGFQAIEIACWPLAKAARRYAGVTHIDVTTLDKARGQGYPRDAGWLRPDHFIAWILSKSAAP